MGTEPDYLRYHRTTVVAAQRRVMRATLLVMVLTLISVGLSVVCALVARGHLLCYGAAAVALLCLALYLRALRWTAPLFLVMQMVADEVERERLAEQE